MTPPDISIVVPVFNEAENLPILIDRIVNAMDGHSFEVVIVNDGSDDGTDRILLDLAGRSPELVGVNLCRNFGQSAALLAGFRRARGKYLLTMDGDLQNDPADFLRFVELLQTHDCVFGYRASRHDSWVRILSSRIANSVRNFVLHDGIRDSGCGIKGFRRECVEHIVPFNGVHRFMAVLIRSRGFNIVEMPVNHSPRLHGTTKYGINNRLWRGIFDLAGVYWLRRRYVDPVVRKESGSE